MNTRTDRHGNALCDTCGVVPDAESHLCDISDVLSESIRKVIARAMAQRSGAEVATRLTLETVSEFLTANRWAIVDENLNIVEVL
jgi:hypothetical protein